MPSIQTSTTQTITTTETTLGAAVTGNINLGCVIDLTSMEATAQVVVVNVYIKVVSGGADVLFKQYLISTKPANPNELAWSIEPVPAPYGCTIKIYRIGGSDFSAGFFVAAV